MVRSVGIMSHVSQVRLKRGQHVQQHSTQRSLLQSFMSCLPFNLSHANQEHTKSNGLEETSSLLANHHHLSTTYNSFPSVDHPIDPLPSSPPEIAYGPRRHRRSDAVFSINGLDGCPSYPSLSSESTHTTSPKRSSYDQFTTINWLHDTIETSRHHRWLSSLPGLRGCLLRRARTIETWLIIVVIGALVALMAYTVDSIEPWFFDLRLGYCRSGWYRTERFCCSGKIVCQDWTSWGDSVALQGVGKHLFDYFVYITSTVILASLSCLLAMRVKLQISPNFSSLRTDPDLATFNPSGEELNHGQILNPQSLTYPATGSGVAEVRVILSGFVIHGYLGMAAFLVSLHFFPQQQRRVGVPC